MIESERLISDLLHVIEKLNIKSHLATDIYKALIVLIMNFC